MEIIEKEIIKEPKKEYASKGVAGTALGLGIAGTALGLFNNGGFGGLFGGNSNCSANADSQACAFVNKDTFWRQNVELEKELGVQRYDNLKANYDLYITLDNKISNLATKQAQYDAALPLTFELAKVNAERYTDDKVYKAELANCKQFGIIEYQLAHKINGQLGLPWSSIISGIPTMPQCTMEVSCPKS